MIDLIQKETPLMNRASSLVSRNISVGNRRTSIRLEPEMWEALRDIARREGKSMNAVCGLVERRKRANSSLTAAIRVFVMLYFRAASTEEGHARVGHGLISRMATMDPCLQRGSTIHLAQAGA